MNSESAPAGPLFTQAGESPHGAAEAVAPYETPYENGIVTPADGSLWCPNCGCRECIDAGHSVDGDAHGAWDEAGREAASDLVKLIPTDSAPEPELAAQFAVTAEDARSALKDAIGWRPLAPSDLKLARLVDRLTPWLRPVWLVDLRVQGSWRALGAWPDDLVVGVHRLDEHEWTTDIRVEDVLDWFETGGELERDFDNVPAAASTRPWPPRVFGPDTLRTAVDRPMDPAEIPLWRLPDVPFAAAVRSALAAVPPRAAEDCRTAAGASALRGFEWELTDVGARGSLMLLPMWSTYYTDDRGAPHALQVDGLTGEVTGTIVPSKSGLRLTRVALVGLGIALGLVLVVAMADPDALEPILWLSAAGLALAMLVPYLALTQDEAL